MLLNLQKIIFEMSKKTKLNFLDVELILAYFLKKTREFVLAHPEYKITRLQEKKIKKLISRRVKGLPIAYLTGHKEFYGLNFKVNKNVLIPRPETELMVEEALKLIVHNSQPTTLIDVGTGSGCIIITILKKLLTFNFQLSTFNFLAIDISEKTLAVAKKNAKLHSVNKQIKFLPGNLLNPLFKNSKLKIKNSKILILANLPYLTPAQIKNSPSIKHEPKLALKAGPDGLKYYKKLFQQINWLNINHQLSIICLCEIDPSQTQKIKTIIKKELPKATCQIKKDLRGLNRLIIIKN